MLRLARRAAFAAQAKASLSSPFARSFASTASSSFNVLESGVNANSEDYKQNAAVMEKLIQELRTRQEEARMGGGAKAIEKHIQRNKLPPRERVAGETGGEESAVGQPSGGSTG